jgi:hypothetical protein
MELLTPIDEVTESLAQIAPKQDGESGQPQELDDEPQQIAKLLERQNVTYDPVWEAAERVYPQWQPVRCNSLRRAILLASSATQHRTKAFEVRRRGRLVCVRLVPSMNPRSDGHALAHVG